ncbi:Acyl-coenzyme A oxidase 3, peroxisomal [Capsicum baccatum]|uniref:Acyl-coenzyme A oxidase 3, peroxisomal n=1 Tax=Capsicum baccatum TaxID=33114 RepID=A0A2G2VRR7_CAPBA|nr:Acyl-coenzyme A oxidase 3, peroxisomal [Capsicum baccatum]
MRQLMDGHNLTEKDWLFGLMLQSNLFNPMKSGGKVFVQPDYNQSKEQQREITMRRIGYLLEHGVFKKWLTGNGPVDELRKLALLECLAIFDHSLAIKTGVHFFLCYKQPELSEPSSVFDIKEMRKLMDGHNLEARDWLYGLMLQSNLFNPIERGGKVFVFPDYSQSKEQQREITMRRIGYLLERGVFKRWLTGDGPEDELRKLALVEGVCIFDHSLAIKIGVTYFLCYNPPELSEPSSVFDIKEMRKLMDGHNFDERDWLFGLMLQSKLFNPIKKGGKVFVSPDYSQCKEQQREITMRRIEYFVEHGGIKEWLTGKGSENELRNLARAECVSIFDYSLGIKLGVHLFLCFKHEKFISYFELVKCIKEEDGTVLVEDVLIRKRWQSYFHKLLNDEGNKGFALGDLENSERCRDNGYCRRTKVEEVKGDIRRLRRGG